MKKLALITIAVIGAATILWAQEKKQPSSKATNESNASRQSKPIGPKDATSIKTAEDVIPANATFIGTATLIEKAETPAQKTAELNAAPVKAAPRAQESKPVAR